MAMDMTSGSLSSPVGPLLERSLDEVEATPTTEGEKTPLAPTDSPPGGNLLGALLQNADLLSALPTLMENLSPLLGSVGRGVGSGGTATRPHIIDRHTALLCALKPYLSSRRRDAAATVIRLCRVWDALEKSGVSLAGLAGALGGASAPREGGDERVQ